MTPPRTISMTMTPPPAAPSYSLVPTDHTARPAENYVLAPYGTPAHQVIHLQHAYGRPGQPAPAPETRVIAIEDIVRCILDRWKSAFVISSLAAALLAVVLLGRVPQYESQASLIMQTRDDKVFNFDKIVDNTGEVNSIPSLLNNHKTQMKSRKFQEFLFANLSQAEVDAYVAPPENPPIASKLISKLLSIFSSAEEGSPEEQRLAAFFARMEKVGVDFIKETHILKASVSHHSPVVAANMANAYVKNYEAYMASEERLVTGNATAFLKQQADELRGKVVKAEQALAAFRSEKGLIGNDDISGSNSEKIKLLGSEIARTEVDLAKVEQTVKLIDTAGSNVDRLLSIEAISTYPGVASIRQQWMEKIREKESINAIYLPKHPKYIDFQKQYEAVEGEVRRAISQAMTEQRNKAVALRNQRQSLQDSLKKNETAALGGDTAQRNVLVRQLEADRTLYDKIMARLNEVSVSNQFENTTNLRISDKAVPALKPSSPNKPITLALAGFTFAGLFITIPLAMALFGLVRERGLVGAMRSASAHSKTSPPSEIAPPSVPMAQPHQLPQLPASPTVPLRPALLGAITLLTPQEATDPHAALVRAFQTQTPLARGFTRLANALAQQDGPSPKVTLLTSIRPAEGKSQLAAGISAANVMGGRKTLLIDCHPSHPETHVWLPHPPGVPGLKQLLLMGESIFDANVLRYANSDLFVLHLGTEHVHDGLFDHPAFAELLRSQFANLDHIVFDGPSLENVRELRSLARHANQIALVCHPASTGSLEFQSALEQLSQIASHIQSVGTIECA